MVVVPRVVSGGAILRLQTIGRNFGCTCLYNFYTGLKPVINFHSSVNGSNQHFFLSSLAKEGKQKV